jgi:Uma2 family endonuclease
MAVLTLPGILPNIPRHTFTVDDYYRMAEIGVLRREDRVELIYGEIIDMTPIGNEHSSVVDQLAQYFHKATQEQAIVRVQNPIRISDASEPQPDLILLRCRSDFYRKDHPKPQDSLLIVEVADSSLDFDRKVKAPLYAQNNIPELWIINLAGQSIEVFRNPVNGQYTQTQVLKSPATIAPLAFPDHPLKLAELFPD